MCPPSDICVWKEMKNIGKKIEFLNCNCNSSSRLPCFWLGLSFICFLAIILGLGALY